MEHAHNDHSDPKREDNLESEPPSAEPAAESGMNAEEPGTVDSSNDAVTPLPPPDEEEEAWGTIPLSIPADRMELLQFMVADLQSVPGDLGEVLKDASDHASREEAGASVIRMAEEMAKVTEFFEFSSLVRLTTVLRSMGQAISEVDDQILPEIVLRAKGVGLLIEQFCATLGVGMEIAWPLRTFERRIGLLLAGRPLHPELCAWHRLDPERVLELDGVTMGAEDPPTIDDEAPAGAVRIPPSAAATPSQNANAETESTIRIGRRRIDDIFDSIRQLVLTKNQILSSARAMQLTAPDNMAASCAETVARAEHLDRLIGGLRESFAEARMQAADRLLERYEKLTRDIGNITGKNIELKLFGAETQLDKFVLEELAEPLNQIVRVACHAIESVDVRRNAGKPDHGTITVRVSSQGSKVVFEISDDGSGMSELCSEDHPDMADLIERRPADLLEGHTPSSPLSGVGALLRRINANAEISVEPGAGTRLTINIPIRGAVISAVLVRAGGHVLAIPLTAVTEIIPAQKLLTPQGEIREMCNIRGRVLAAFDLASRLGLASSPDQRRLAVVIKADHMEAAAVIDAVLGHQEFVVEDLASEYTSDTPVLGATIRDDGEVCMIIDCFRLLRCQSPAQMSLAA
jgi:chemotaxis protein histidine kinase CheA